MPTLDPFIESLTHDKDKLIKMGTIKEPNAYAFYLHESSNTCSPRPRKKVRERCIQSQRRKGTPNPSMIPRARKVEKERNGIPNAVTATMFIILRMHA
jgi:hypothetical protein